jgi:hypothetical protein
MKVTSYYCDVCSKDIVTDLVDDVKGINLRIDLDHGTYESYVFPHVCYECRKSVAMALSEWKEKHKRDRG